MVVFLGTHECKVDQKNRVVLPLLLRKCVRENREQFFQEGFMLTPGDKNEYLELYPRNEFEARAVRLRERYLPEDKAGDNYVRRVNSSAVPIEVDSQCRFSIPPRYKGLVGIQDDVAFVGNQDKIEIWAKDRFERWQADNGSLSVPTPQRP